VTDPIEVSVAESSKSVWRRAAVAGVCAAAGALALTAGAAPRRAPVAAPIRLVPGALLATLRGSSSPPTTASCQAASHGRTSCYDPAQLQAAYDLAPLFAKGIEGQHETIVIVDAFGSPTITSDLATFDTTFGLPAPPSFKILRPRGNPPAYKPGAKDRFGWASETSLDVEWAHAMAPKAAIDLLETPTDEVEGTSGFPDIIAAENFAISHHLGAVISQSFGATEQTFASKSQITNLRSAFLAAHKANVTVLGGSGDLGATDYESNASSIYPFRVTSWPASDPLVTAIGGTRLNLSGSGTALSPAVAWNDSYEGGNPLAPAASGGGHSEYFSRPSYQNVISSQAGSHRAVPDVSMSAACTGLVDVYLSVDTGSPGWYPMCGTSEATPLFAGIVALADQAAGHPLGFLNPSLYALLSKANSGIVPVTSGNNTVSFASGTKRITVTGFTAHAGYNLVTGIGTIDAGKFVPALVREWKALHPA
jgi:subtilase family serine protease